MLPEVYPGKCSCSVILGWPLPRVGKVAGSEATTTKRWNAIPQITYFIERTRARVRRELRSKHIVLMQDARTVRKINMYTQCLGTHTHIYTHTYKKSSIDMESKTECFGAQEVDIFFYE